MNRLQEKIHPLLTEEVVLALRLKQIFTVLDFIKADTQQITKFARLNFREVLTIKNFLLRKFSADPTNGFDYYKTTLKNTTIIPTGIKGVDNLLDGGLLTGNIYELCGLPASGKTHFVLTVLKNVVQIMQQQVYILDTKNDFSALKLNNMLEGYDKDRHPNILSQVIVQRTYSKHDLINSLYKIKTDLENTLKARLIVIDSLPCILLNSNDLPMNNAFLNHLANIIRYISITHHIAFLITNLINTWSDSDFNVQHDTLERFSCGKYWFTVPNTRIKIEKAKNGKSCDISIVNSDTLAHKINSSAEILLTNKGFL